MNPALPSERFLPTWVGVGCFFLVLGVFGAPVADLHKAALFNGVFILYFGAACWDCWVRSVREPRHKLGWRLLVVGGVQALATGLALMLSLFRSGLSVGVAPRWALAPWAVAVVLEAAATLAFPRPREQRREQVRAVLDGIIFASSLFLVIWLGFLQDLLSRSILSPLDDGLVVLFYVTSAAGLGVSAHLVTDGKANWRGPIGFIGANCLALCLLNPPWIEALLTRTYHQAHPARIILLPAWLLLFLAARRPWPTTMSAPKRPVLALQDWLPHLPAALAFIAVGAAYLPAQRGLGPAGIGLLMLLALLVGARQLLNLRDVRDLRRNLEEKVEIRTQDLAASQNLLLKTQRMNLVASIGAGLVHDINNLIGAGISYARLLRMNLGQRIPLEQDDIDELRGALVKGEELTSQLMAFAQDKQGTPSRFDATERIRGMAPLLRILVPKGISLELDLDAAPMPLRADPGQLDQVLVNLVSNAKDATPQGGRIRIRTSRVPEPAESGGACFGLEVADTGSGIPPELVERIFEPLFTTKDPGKGTGLGLSSVKGVVDGMGGRLHVESGIGTGTTFRILIPLA